VVRDPWTLVAAVIAFGMMAWLVLVSPKSHALRNESPHSFDADPDLRLLTADVRFAAAQNMDAIKTGDRLGTRAARATVRAGQNRDGRIGDRT
jgi:hypothetical protein